MSGVSQGVYKALQLTHRHKTGPDQYLCDRLTRST